MSWLKIVIDIALALLPGLALKKSKNLEQELLIATKTIDFMSNRMDPEEKGKYLEQAIGSLSAVKNFKKRSVKKLNKAKSRLYKKYF